MTRQKQEQSRKEWQAVCAASAEWRSEPSKSPRKRGLKIKAAQAYLAYVVKWDLPQMSNAQRAVYNIRGL